MKASVPRQARRNSRLCSSHQVCSPQPSDVRLIVTIATFSEADARTGSPLSNIRHLTEFSALSLNTDVAKASRVSQNMCCLCFLRHVARQPCLAPLHLLIEVAVWWVFDNGPATKVMCCWDCYTFSTFFLFSQQPFPIYRLHLEDDTVLEDRRDK